MERSIDQHEVRRSRATVSSTLAKIAQWREAWIACYQVVEDWQTCDLKRFHTIFERWVPILNWVFKNPIPHLERYNVLFYYCQQSNGPKEILQLYMDENPVEAETTVHVVFNLYEFNLIHKHYCQNMGKSNQLLVNEARGTVNLSSCHEYDCNPADYFQTMTTWQMLFLYTLHALAHWDAYDKYEHGYYDTHLYVRDSPFFKLYFYGQIVYRK